LTLLSNLAEVYRKRVTIAANARATRVTTLPTKEGAELGSDVQKPLVQTVLWHCVPFVQEEPDGQVGQVGSVLAQVPVVQSVSTTTVEGAEPVTFKPVAV